MEQNTRHKLDLRGAIIPFTFLKIRQVFASIQPGDILEVFWNDPDTTEDLYKILPESSYDLLVVEERKEKVPFYRMKIRKKSAETVPSRSPAKDINPNHPLQGGFKTNQNRGGKHV